MCILKIIHDSSKHFKSSGVCWSRHANTIQEMTDDLCSLSVTETEIYCTP